MSFVRTVLGDIASAWAIIFLNCSRVAGLAALAPWLHHYNWHRPHYSLNLKPPASRLNLSPDNLLKLHT